MNLNLFFLDILLLNLAIILLLIIASFSILGTIIEQNQTVEYYKLNYAESSDLLDLNWKIIVGSGLDHVYSTWWYLSLLVLFGTCLLSCTFVQQLPTLKVARKYFSKLTRHNLKNKNLTLFLNTTHFLKLLKNLKQKNFIIFQQNLSISIVIKVF